MQLFKNAAMSVAVFLCGWQIGLFACSAIDPSAAHGDCQAPKCQNYAQVCPSGWQVGYVAPYPHRCCRAYKGSHRIYGDPPCCEWSRRFYSYVMPGCRPFICRTGSPPNVTARWHCERQYATRYGNWVTGDIWICVALGDSRNCNEKFGYCERL